MYYWTLLLHSGLRWGVLILGIAAALKALVAWRAGKSWERSDDLLGMFYIISIDLQFLLGILLYFFLSPITAVLFNAPKEAMASSGIRFFAVEHVVMMLIGIALAHIGRAKGRKQSDPVARHKTTAIFFLLSLLAILAGIPWPFLAAGRPLFR